MSLAFHRGLVLDPVGQVGGHHVFACIGVHGCGCLVLDVEQHADWHLRYGGLAAPVLVVKPKEDHRG